QSFLASHLCSSNNVFFLMRIEDFEFGHIEVLKDTKLSGEDTIPLLDKDEFTTRLYTNSSSSTSTSVISTSTSAISTSTSASTNRIYNSDNKCGLSKTLMTEQNNSAKQIKVKIVEEVVVKIVVAHFIGNIIYPNGYGMIFFFIGKRHVLYTLKWEIIPENKEKEYLKEKTHVLEGDKELIGHDFNCFLQFAWVIDLQHKNEEKEDMNIHVNFEVEKDTFFGVLEGKMAGEVVKKNVEEYYFDILIKALTIDEGVLKFCYDIGKID
ncbi:hypothetical protein ACJX0J_023806, partial [Zea mays]